MLQNHAFKRNIYSLEECVDIRKKVEASINIALKDVPSRMATKTAQVGIFELGALDGMLDKFKNLALDANKHLFGFDLHQITELEKLHYNIYKQGAEYTWHTDGAMGEVRDFKLTCLLNVSTEPYEGGEFQLFSTIETTIHEFKEPGSLFMFPSWIPHRVTPVTSGTRHTVTLFLTGPLLK